MANGHMAMQVLLERLAALTEQRKGMVGKLQFHNCQVGGEEYARWSDEVLVTILAMQQAVLAQASTMKFWGAWLNGGWSAVAVLLTLALLEAQGISVPGWVRSLLTGGPGAPE